jgi:hypothetical protein
MSENAAPKQADKLHQADQKLPQEFSTTKGVNGVTDTCPLKKKEKRYYEFGINFKVQQYAIDGRKLALSVPVRPNSAVPKTTPDVDHPVGNFFHQLPTSSFTQSNTCDVPPKFKKAYSEGDPNSPTNFVMKLTNNTRLIAEDNFKDGYEDEQSQQADLNDFLGKALAIHLSRTHTLDTQGNWGNWKMKYLQNAGNTFHITEKMCVKLFAYLKTKLHGKEAIYKIEDGKIGSEITEQDYRKAKLLQTDPHSHFEGDSMPCIPGVQQIHILIKSRSEGGFNVKEIYCDGDRIYPD